MGNNVEEESLKIIDGAVNIIYQFATDQLAKIHIDHESIFSITCAAYINFMSRTITENSELIPTEAEKALNVLDKLSTAYFLNKNSPEGPNNTFSFKIKGEMI